MMKTDQVLTTVSVGIIIVNYGKAARLTSGLDSIDRQILDGQVFVRIVDNSPGSDEQATIKAALANRPLMRLVESIGNIGYSRGMNLASLHLPQTDYVLFMSPDIILDDESVLQRMVDAMRADPDVGILAATQVNDDGSDVEVARRFPSLVKQVARRLSRGRLYQDTELLPSRTETGVTVVDWAQSSFCLTRTDVWARLGGFDERFFIFMADADLSRRARHLAFSTAIARIAGVRADGIRASSGGVISMLRSRSLRIHVADAIRYYLCRVRTTTA